TTSPREATRGISPARCSCPNTPCRTISNRSSPRPRRAAAARCCRARWAHETPRQSDPAPLISRGLVQPRRARVNSFPCSWPVAVTVCSVSEFPPARDPIAAGRAALSGGRWLEARAHFREALAGEAAPAALEGMSWADWWLEDVPACLDTRERSYRMYRQAGDARGAARVALWLGTPTSSSGVQRQWPDGCLRGTAGLRAGHSVVPENRGVQPADGHAVRHWCLPGALRGDPHLVWQLDRGGARTPRRGRRAG